MQILFTHDLHARILPWRDGAGVMRGGFARLATALRRQREKYPSTVTLDGGDFSMGSLFQTLYTSAAPELRLLGAMGYDAVTLGNHEFDYRPEGLAAMLRAALASGERLPALVDANYLPPHGDTTEVRRALTMYGVREYVLIERNDVYFAVLGLTGYNSDSCAPDSGMKLEPPAAAARRVVKKAVAECMARYGKRPLVIALSHGGTVDGRGEDWQLACADTGIDLIVSAHTHTRLDRPILAGRTWIVSAGAYGEYLGAVRLRLNARGAELTDYALIPIDSTLPEDAEIARRASHFRTEVENAYLSVYGMHFDEVLTYNPYRFDSVEEIYGSAHDSALGSLLADAYLLAAERALGRRPDIALTAAGVIRETIPAGRVTVSDVFNTASLGVGAEGELISFWLTGADLKNILEIDASVYPLMHEAQLFFAGVAYSFNTCRIPFNRVDWARLRDAHGTLHRIEDRRLYLAVCGTYVARTLCSVRKTSLGLLTVTPRNAAGEPIPVVQLPRRVLRDGGKPLREWYAIAAYLRQMGGEMEARYSAPDGRKHIYASIRPADFLRNPNRFTCTAAAAAAAALGALLIRCGGRDGGTAEGDKKLAPLK